MNKLEKLFENNFKEPVIKMYLMPQSGSYRKYYRIIGKNNTAIGTYNNDKDENIAFLSLTKHFESQNLPVPHIFTEDLSENIYLQNDLGNTTLYDFVKQEIKDGKFSDSLIKKYKEVLIKLIDFQINGAKNLDWSKCYPRKAFDKQSIMWDLNYFKYYMLKISKTIFNEQLLENDFNTFANFLTSADSNYFLYRDFQSRNIMIYNNEIYFIDYQGGRQGAFYYDLASLLYDAKANISEPVRDQLVEYYFTELQSHIKISKAEFFKYYYSFAIIRILQAFGAYGLRGIIEKKLHFMQSIPLAINNLKYILENKNIEVDILELKKALFDFVNKSEFSKEQNTTNNLTINIKSFSFIQNGYPKDLSGNGGGFVFDCRFLPNPGREQKYKFLSGKDESVIKYLNASVEVETFIANTFILVKEAISNYIERDFSSLSISFGCTGGQHRSVYSAERIKNLIAENYNVNIKIEHENSNNWNTGNTK